MFQSLTDTERSCIIELLIKAALWDAFIEEAKEQVRKETRQPIEKS